MKEKPRNAVHLYVSDWTTFTMSDEVYKAVVWESSYVERMNPEGVMEVVLQTLPKECPENWWFFALLEQEEVGDGKPLKKIPGEAIESLEKLIDAYKREEI